MGWKDAPEVKAAPAWASAPEVGAASNDEPFPVKLGRQVMNAGAGALRGAGSIGATLLTPYDLLAGNTKSIGNPERRRLMDEGFASLGADTDSLAYGAGKIGGEIAGTLGAGGAIANVIGRAAPSVAAAMPNALNAIRTGGMVAGQGGNALAQLGTRAAGGAITGAGSAALVNPDSAGAGALIGGAMPVASKVAGMAGQKIGGVIRGPAQTADMTAAVQSARAQGYVIPPTQARPTLGNRLLEGFSGKITTAQNASAKNQAVTSGIAAKELGLAADTKLTPDVLKGVRQQAGQAFESLRNTGTVTADQTYDKALDAIVAKYKGAAGGFPGLSKPEVESVITTLRQPIFPSDAAVDALAVLREKADAAFGARDKGLGKALKEAAAALEDQMERHLAATGQAPDAVQALRDARKLIAKTYSVEAAMNPASGAVDARKLAAQLAKGKPLSGGLKEAAEFAARFPKAAQTIEGMGSLPQTSPLDWIGAGTLSGVTGNPLVMAGAMARPAARAVALSPMVQNRLAQQAGSPNALQQLLSNSDLAQLGYRVTPALAAGR